jgi:transposase-like protein
MRVCSEIKNRGTRDVLMVVCDGLKGLPDAVNAVWEQLRAQSNHGTADVALYMRRESTRV